MYKIGEFSKICRVPAKTLRYYDAIGLLKPAEVDRFTGYRYYSVQQLARLNRILALKDLGLSLEQIGRLLADDVSAEEIRGMLRRKQVEIQQLVDDEQARLARVAARLAQIEQEGIMSNLDVSIKRIEALRVLSVRRTAPTVNDVGQFMEEVFGTAVGCGVQIIAPPVVLYHDKEFTGENIDIEITAPVGPDYDESVPLPGGDTMEVKTLPELPQAASVIHRGEYDQFEQTYAALGQWVAENGYQIAGPSREIYLTPGSGPDAITEIQWPVEKA
jgi:DNA-binding transcriptional MerR regulator